MRGDAQALAWLVLIPFVLGLLGLSRTILGGLIALGCGLAAVVMALVVLI